MIPLSVANQVHTTLIDYLQTTFSFQDDGLQQALGQFLSKNLFQGPFVDLRLPFRKAGSGEAMPLEIGPPFVPYVHQLAAFQRLAGGEGRTPAPTLITTGTGSGKTECFTYPILDHCHRHRDEPGIKAIILYPMNALATDQAGRLAEAIWADERLRGQVTAGVYIGGENKTRRKQMGADWLIDDRDTLRQQPPDILLTNYKMLDFLLLRPEDKPLWAFNGPETLRYLVLDELHTYDGAQESDVAGLVRRLRARLDTPDGWLVPVGTSATIDSGGTFGAVRTRAEASPAPTRDDPRRGDPCGRPLTATQDPAGTNRAVEARAGSSPAPTGADALLRFAQDIFGVPFDESSIVRESRLALADFLNAAPTVFDLPISTEPLREVAGETADQYLQRIAVAWFPSLTSDTLPDPVVLGEHLRAHAFLRTLLDAARAIVAWPDLRERVARADIDFAALPEADQDRVLESFLALIAHARTAAGTPDATRLEPFLTLQVQLWIREMSRLMRAVGTEPAFFWRDDYPEDTLPRGLPAYYCRECGHSGWLSHMHDGDQRLTSDVSRIYRGYFERNSHVRYVYPGQRLGEYEGAGERLCPDCLRVGYHERCEDCGATTFPVVIHADLSRPRGAQRQQRDNQRCPICDADDALTIVGAQAASLASVLLSHLFTSPINQDKKLLAFTDSVQDAAHRAAFFGARTYRFNLRTAIQATLLAADSSSDFPDGVPLNRLTPLLLDHWRGRWQAEPDREQRLAATFLPSDLSELATYQAFMAESPGPMPPALERDLTTRLSWEVAMEYGLNARLGRSLEKVGSSVAHIDSLRLDALLPDLLLQLRNEHGLLADLDGERLRHFVAGLLERTRTRGGIAHPLLRGYVNSEGQWYLLTKNRQPLLSPFHKRSPRFPKFLADRSNRGVFDVYLSPGKGLTWYLDWPQRSLNHSLGLNDVYELYRLLMPHLMQAGILQQESVGKNHVYGLKPDALLVTTKTESMRCDTCNLQYTLAAVEAKQWLGRPCINYHCEGHFQRDERAEQHYYRALYARGQVERVFSREHTGLLDRDVREDLEREFKERTRADAANLITATPTLEMGIDIGDLSATLATSIPPTTANYLQRIGRAGRKTGNALVLAQALVRPHDLYFFAEPLEMLAGAVEPPGCFLNAPDMLKRHYLAYCMDCWTQEIAKPRDLPRKVQFMLSRAKQGEFPENLLAFVDKRRQALLDGFLSLYGEAISDNTREQVLDYTAGDQMAMAVRAAMDRARAEREDLRAARAAMQQELKRLEADPSEYADADEQMTELKRDMQLLVRLIKNIDEQYVLNFFTDAGLLPNYAFPESGVKLRAIITNVPDAEPPYEIHEYERPAATALRELAPYNKFYAQGRKMTVNQIEVPGHGQSFERWQFCNACSHMELVQASHYKERCPKCGSLTWHDLGQQHSMVQLRQVTAHDKYFDSLLGDDTDERDREVFDTALAFEIEPDWSSGASLIPSLPFGLEHFRQVTLREMNFGSADGWGQSVEIAGEERSSTGFRTCPDCGAVVPPAGNDDDRQEVQHARSCKHQRAGTEPDWQEVYLYREMVSEALCLLLPVSTTLVDEKLATFAACLGLGLKQYLGGDPSHLQIAPHTAIGLDGTQRRYLVLYDTVPGGTSYLADLATPENLRTLLAMARETLASCSCRLDPHKQACYRCLYSFRSQRDLGLLSRQLGLELLQEILANWSDLTPIHSLAETDMHSVIESELEQRFVDAIQKHADKQRNCRMVPDLYKGKESWVLTVDDTRWRIEPQVLLDRTHGVTLSCRADFVFWPLGADKGNRRPIAVFTDGMAYHVQPGQPTSRLPDDVAKRRAIVDSGRFWVWSITWDDVVEFADNKPFSLPSFFSTKLEKKAGNMARNLSTATGTSVPGKTQLSNACQQLMNYLQMPNDSAWQRYAVAWPLVDLLDARRPLVTMQVAVEKAEALAVDTQAPDLSIDASSEPGEIQYGVISRHGSTLFSTVALPDLQAKKWNRLTIVHRLEDSPDARSGDLFRTAWRWYWLLGNVLQFAPGFRAWMAASIDSHGEELLEWLEARSAGSETDPVADAAWQEALDYADPACAALLSACRQSNVPAPTVGYELKDSQGRIAAAAELAWPDARIVVFLPDESDEDRGIFKVDGWRCFDVEQVEGVVETLTAGST